MQDSQANSLTKRVHKYMALAFFQEQYGVYDYLQLNKDYLYSSIQKTKILPEQLNSFLLAKNKNIRLNILNYISSRSIQPKHLKKRNNIFKRVELYNNSKKQVTVKLPNIIKKASKSGLKDDPKNTIKGISQNVRINRTKTVDKESSQSKVFKIQKSVLRLSKLVIPLIKFKSEYSLKKNVQQVSLKVSSI